MGTVLRVLLKRGSPKSSLHPKNPAKTGIPMCFTVLLATDSPTDLSLHDGHGVLFRPAEPDEARAAKPPYSYVYDVAGDKEGCACCFNFYGTPDNGSHPFWDNGGFRQPAKSGEETAQEQRETLYLLDVIRRLVRNGAKVQAACVWSGDRLQLREPAVEVALHALNPHAFALFENVRFEFAT